MVNSSFYVVNFLLLIRSSFSFYMVKSTFYLVNFLLFNSWIARMRKSEL